MHDNTAEEGLRQLRQVIDEAKSRREQRRRKSLNGYWHEELTAFNAARNHEHAAQEFAAYCFECGEDLLHGADLSVPTMVLLTTVMGKRLLRSDEILAKVSELCRARQNEFTPGERAAQTRAFANLRHGHDPLVDSHVAVMMENDHWLFDDTIALLWALLLAGRDIPAMLGDDPLMRFGKGGHGQFHRFRDLYQIQLMYDFKVPEGVALRASNAKGPKHPPLVGSQSPLEEQIADALVALGLPFEQQQTVGGYSADFVVEMDGQRIVLEAMGYFVHYLSDLRSIAKGSASAHRPLVQLSDDLRGEDGLRARIFRKLGYKVVFLNGAQVPHRLERRTEALLSELRGAI